jgi:hypothetical protein
LKENCHNAGRSPRLCCFCMTMPQGLLVSWSPTPFSVSGPFGLPPVPWTEKTIERWPFFCPTWRSLLPWTTFWIFFD